MCYQDNQKPRKIQARTIRALIRARFGSISAFCRVTGISRWAAYALVRGEFGSPRRFAVMAEALGKTPHELWPKRFPAPVNHEPAA